eukprot:EC123013.1.p1 GENE.EC123013.1~~EC123013.1.p1  ORF type:complete len:172 (-),score=18.18 EC123013.1:48-563(-)
MAEKFLEFGSWKKGNRAPAFGDDPASGSKFGGYPQFIQYLHTLSDAKNEVKPGVGFDDLTELAYPESEGSVFKRFLHLASTEHAQISTIFRTAAVAFRTGKIGKFDFLRYKASPEFCNNLVSFLFCPSNVFLLPGRRSPGTAVLDKNMGAPHLFRHDTAMFPRKQQVKTTR